MKTDLLLPHFRRKNSPVWIVKGLKNLRTSIDHYVFCMSVIVLVHMIARFLLFSNAHSIQCILDKTESLKGSQEKMLASPKYSVTDIKVKSAYAPRGAIIKA